jgi:hypothetical protein
MKRMFVFFVRTTSTSQISQLFDLTPGSEPKSNRSIGWKMDKVYWIGGECVLNSRVPRQFLNAV